VRDQRIPNNVNVSDVTSRKKRLAQQLNHKHKCEMKKSFISLKELNLEGVIIYPTMIETVDCSGNCHKHRSHRYQCRPTDFKDVEFVYVGEAGSPKIKKLNKFLPNSCHCAKINAY